MSEAWKSIIDADLKDAEFAPRTPIPDGDYPVFVSSIEAKVFTTGSKGLAVTYVIESGDQKDRDLRESIILVLKDGSPNKMAAATIKKLMLECGLTLDEIRNFRYPDFGTKGFGDFAKLLGKTLTVNSKVEMQKDGLNKGKYYARVKSFKARVA